MEESMQSSPGSSVPPLKPLHADGSLLPLKLRIYGISTTEYIIESLKPGEKGSLKVRADGTVIDVHHRIKILRNRGVDVDALPREIIPYAPIDDPIQ